VGVRRSEHIEWKTLDDDPFSPSSYFSSSTGEEVHLAQTESRRATEEIRPQSAAEEIYFIIYKEKRGKWKLSAQFETWLGLGLEHLQSRLDDL
jgi:hypothetical protein